MYKWKADKNSAFIDDNEKSLLEQLPSYVQDKIYGGFLFNDFL